jgi:lipoprotein-anchoring transpeptidase ErfK/SrfK
MRFALTGRLRLGTLSIIMQRRKFLQLGLVSTSALLVGCTTSSETTKKVSNSPSKNKVGTIYSDAYGSVNDGGFRVPAVPIDKLDKKYHRQIVRFKTRHPKNTVIVNTKQRHLYYILGGGKAVRYGIGVGRAGFAWEGEAYVAWKRPWPTWTPPKEMIQRQPRLRKYADGGMQPGLRNPLGARALYLFDSETKQDTLYRLHGTPEWNSIGTAASSGCIRLINQDVMDLYDRVKPGRRTKVIVIQ